jgi:hypothetical protein
VDDVVDAVEGVVAADDVAGATLVLGAVEVLLADGGALDVVTVLPLLLHPAASSVRVPAQATSAQRRMR